MDDVITGGRRRKYRQLTDYHVKRMILAPSQWVACKLPVVLKWNPVKFTKANKSRISKDCGVYTFLVQPGIADHPCCSYLLYVGETERQTFQQRYQQYLQEKEAGDSSRRPHITDMLQKWDGYLWFCYAKMDRRDLITQVEDTLLAAYLPPTNKDFPATVSAALKKVFGT